VTDLNVIEKALRAIKEAATILAAVPQVSPHYLKIKKMICRIVKKLSKALRVLSLSLPGRSKIKRRRKIRDKAFLTNPEITHRPDEKEVEGCKRLLTEIIKRAVYDWVLYRRNKKLNFKRLARDAYTWLFLEDERHSYHRERVRNDKYITGFLPICAALGLDPNEIREGAKKLTPRVIMNMGRPPEHRKTRDPEVDVCPTYCPVPDEIPYSASAPSY